MRHSLSLYIMPILPLCFVSACFGQGTNAVADLYRDTNAIHNFRLLLDFPTNTFTNGETVLCHFGLTNVSESTTIIDPSFVGENLYFLLTKPSGLQVKSEHDYYSVHPYLGPERVPPHSPEKYYYWLCPMSDYIAISPGTYQVCVEREAVSGTNEFSYTSSVVTITILPPPPPKATNNPTPKTN